MRALILFLAVMLALPYAWPAAAQTADDPFLAVPSTKPAKPKPKPAATPAPAPAAQAAAQLKECADCPEMVRIPAGSFMMGVPEAESARENSGDTEARPVHQVRIGQAFYLGRYLVTRGEYRAFATATGHTMQDPGFPQDDRHPAVIVSWDDAQAYVAWLSQRTGKPYRLPSEAEWEYAARAGTATARYWGDSSDQQCQFGNGFDASGKAKHPEYTWTSVSCDDGYAETSPVGRYRANGFGLYDMLGNAWEWVQDCYDGHGYASAPSDGSAVNTESCSFRVLRGGSWNYGPRFLRAGNRFRFGPADRIDNIGLRVARTLTP